MKKLLLSTMYFLIVSTLSAQINYTANDTVPIYTNDFLYGSNMGYYPPWKDGQLADIAAGNADLGIPGVGVKTLRPALPEFYLEAGGYDNRLSVFQHYDSLGIKDITAFIGYPSDNHRDTTHYCSSSPYSSELFANMYEDIWDGGENGTPVNDDNYYALYLYKMIPIYKDYVKFWEIWNEPDFDYSGNAWRPAGMEGNWWDSNPDPCDYKLRAPVFDYVRLLRISYEVIKYLDPEAYVAIGGLGYPSFLDAVMRNTDNPVDGSMSNDHPKLGGAYFDCMSFHTYPHINGSLRYWDNDIDGFVYTRHSDAAVYGVLEHRDEFKQVLDNYGYDGNTYPQKTYIITECNIPRMAFDNYIGSTEAQRNFLIKTLVTCQKEEIEQFYVYNLGEKEYEDVADSSFDLMGLYESLNDDGPYTQNETDGGISYKTTSDLLFGYHFDPIRTERMAIPDTLDGAAFRDTEGEYLYVLWAKTSIDQSETANGVYNFPAILDIVDVDQYEWDYSQTGETQNLSSQGINLTGTPVFLRKSTAVLPVELLALEARRKSADIILEWVTNKEINNDYFTVEHAAGNRPFESIGEVDGAGTTDEAQYYQFAHNRAVRGVNYYRLRQVDFDGSVQYSPSVAITIEVNDLFLVRPSHAANEIHVEFYDFHEKDIELSVFDLVGKKRMEDYLVAGRNAITLSIDHLEAGHYFIRMKVLGIDYFTQRFIKIKL